MISFQQVLDSYEIELENLKSWMEHFKDDKEYITIGKGKYRGMNALMHDIKGDCYLELLSKTNSILVERKPTEDEINKWGKDKGCPLVDIIVYRGLVGRVYLDDNGQQKYMICEGKEWSGGAYNDALFDFSDFMDSIADEKILGEFI